ncbi:MAG: hypothetical protein HUU15_20295, partial [Candidatus Brocadiae bacterium]|nr:hypothetical protein [Candidatus Brocadiia bacterium]
LARRIEELEARPPVGSDPASWERVRTQFEERLRDAARRNAELEREAADMRTELENARALLTRATVERQQLRSRVEALELASVSSPSDKLDAMRADLRRLEIERDEAIRDMQVLRSRLEATEGRAGDLSRERERLESEIRERSGGGLLSRLGRAIRGE